MIFVIPSLSNFNNKYTHNEGLKKASNFSKIRTFDVNNLVMHIP